MSSNIIDSLNGSTQIVSASAQNPTGTVAASYNIAVFTAVNYNFYGAYNTTTGIFTAVTSGYYDFFCQLEFTGTFALNDNCQSMISINGNPYVYGGGYATPGLTSVAVRSSAIIYLSIGDQVAFNSYCTASSPAYITATSGSNMSIARVGD